MTQLARTKHTVPRAEQWADRICTQHGKSVESIIDTGRLLVKAKADLAHGEWGRLFDDKLVPFGIRSAQMLMEIAEHPTIGNTKHASYLPPSWDSLYRLTKAEPKRLSAAFKDGLITPDMKRSDVKALMPLSTREEVQPRQEQAYEGEPEQTDVDESEPVTPDYTGHQTAHRVPSAPSNGMQFARIAVMKLEEIRDDDSERQQAFDYVRSWLDARET